MESVIIVHSGAGYFPDEKNAEKLAITKEAAIEGYKVLMSTGNPVDAVERAVRVMEDNPSCNAGYGSVLNELGQVEMDAMIIRGSDLATGGVGALAHVRNPISVARAVMDETKHVFLAGRGAEDFAKTQGFEIVQNADLVTPRAKTQLEAVLAKTAIASTETGGETGPHKEPGLGTVGAVAINGIGKLAAATSTGGISGKLAGRIGDTPIPGGGTYCDDLSCGISATGLGESIMRYCLSSKIAAYIDNGFIFSPTRWLIG